MKRRREKREKERERERERVEEYVVVTAIDSTTLRPRERLISILLIHHHIKE